MKIGYQLFALFVVFGMCHSEETSCLQSERLFADLCFNPKPLIDLDAAKFQKIQPADGWHVDFGNDIFRLHLAEAVKGKLLKLEDITDDFCPKIKIEHGDSAHHADGEYFGFGELYANFTCDGSKDYPTLLRCKLENSKGPNFTELINTYISYASPKGIFVLIGCFETGEVGWYSAAVSNKLTAEEEKDIEDHAKALGFPTGTTVRMYNDSCNNCRSTPISREVKIMIKNTMKSYCLDVVYFASKK